MHFKLLSLVLLTTISCIATTSQTTKTNEPKKLNAAEFIKKYWKPRDDTPIIINDYLDSIDRVDLNNKYYHISYNKKCFKVEPIMYNPADFVGVKNPSEEVPGLVFFRKKECINSSEQIFSNDFQITQPSTVSDDQAKKIFTKNNTSQLVMISHLIILNSIRGSATAYAVNIDTPDAEDIRIRYSILCTGKRNEMYQIELRADSYQEQLDFVTKYNYKLPDDIMQIISTFKCRKDR